MTRTLPQLEDPPATASDLARVGVIVPTYNAAAYWPGLRAAVDSQGLEPEQILIIDSSSTDQTRALAARAGYKLVHIDQRDFSHGGTRQQAIDCLPSAEILLYLTQDALPADSDAFRTLCAAFSDPVVGAAYGRQLPRVNAGPIERHARIFNYPEQSSVRTFESRHRIGIKAAFLSNSFAAYRRSALEQVGGFPTDVIMAEDSIVAARLLLAGWNVAYVSQASVIHSHPLTLAQEFSRYFDTGVHHTHQQWLLDAFGTAGEEGHRFLQSELAYLRRVDPSLIPVAVLRTLNKFFAYHLGRHENLLPRSLKSSISCQPEFWRRSRPPLDQAPSSSVSPQHSKRIADQTEHRPAPS